MEDARMPAEWACATSSTARRSPSSLRNGRVEELLEKLPSPPRQVQFPPRGRGGDHRTGKDLLPRKAAGALYDLRLLQALSERGEYPDVFASTTGPRCSTTRPDGDPGTGRLCEGRFGADSCLRCGECLEKCPSASRFRPFGGGPRLPHGGTHEEGRAARHRLCGAWFRLRIRSLSDPRDVEFPPGSGCRPCPCPGLRMETMRPRGLTWMLARLRLRSTSCPTRGSHPREDLAFGIDRLLALRDITSSGRTGVP